MESAAILGLLVLVSGIGIGLLVTAALYRAAFSLRRGMFERAVTLLRASDLAREDRDFLNYCLDNALSFRAGWLSLRAVWRAIVTHRSHLNTLGPGNQSHAGVTSVGLRFMLSTLVANPVALLLFAPSVLVLMILERETVRPAVRQTATNLPVSYNLSLA